MNVAATLSSSPHVGVASSYREELGHLRDESGIDYYAIKGAVQALANK